MKIKIGLALDVSSLFASVPGKKIEEGRKWQRLFRSAMQRTRERERQNGCISTRANRGDVFSSTTTREAGHTSLRTSRVQTARSSISIHDTPNCSRRRKRRRRRRGRTREPHFPHFLDSTNTKQIDDSNVKSSRKRCRELPIHLKNIGSGAKEKKKILRENLKELGVAEQVSRTCLKKSIPLLLLLCPPPLSLLFTPQETKHQEA